MFNQGIRVVNKQFKTFIERLRVKSQKSLCLAVDFTVITESSKGTLGTLQVIKTKYRQEANENNRFLMTKTTAIFSGKL